MTQSEAQRVIRNPWQRVLRATVTVQACALSVTAVIAFVIAVVASPVGGRDFIVGGVIAGLPQLWFLARGSANKAESRAVGLALGKFALSATGFAVWFGLKPEANPITTLLGTATFIVVVALGLVIVSRRV
jgi:FtsH-binding integral membrane protein